MVNKVSFGSLYYDYGKTSAAIAEKFVQNKNLRREVKVSSVINHADAQEITPRRLYHGLPDGELEIRSRIKDNKLKARAHERQLMEIIKKEFGIEPFHISN